MRSRYRPSVAQRVGSGIDLLFHDCGTRRGWVVSSMPRLHFTPGKDPVPILQEAGWAPGPVWTGGKSRPHWDSIPDRPSRSQSLYRLSYPAHCTIKCRYNKYLWIWCKRSHSQSHSHTDFLTLCSVLWSEIFSLLPKFIRRNLFDLIFALNAS